MYVREERGGGEGGKIGGEREKRRRERASAPERRKERVEVTERVSTSEKKIREGRVYIGRGGCKNLCRV